MDCCPRNQILPMGLSKDALLNGLWHLPLPLTHSLFTLSVRVSNMP